MYGLSVRICSLDLYLSSLVTYGQLIYHCYCKIADLPNETVVVLSFAAFGRPIPSISCLWSSLFLKISKHLLRYINRLDFLLTFVSVIFNYAGPFFLKLVSWSILCSRTHHLADGSLIQFN